MDLGLSGKTVIVTGASRGLGKTIAEMLAAEGANIALLARKAPQQVAVAVAAEYGVKTVAIATDISDENAVCAAFDTTEQEIGPVDALVNNAAYCPVEPTPETPVAEFNQALRTNMLGTFLMCRDMTRRLIASERHGKIVNISSQAAFRGSQSGKTAYDSTKMGIIGFTISLAREMAKHGFNINCVAPGLMYTEMIAEYVDADPEKFNKRVPLGRLGTTAEVGGVVVFLCSDRASYMTGATVDVSAGLAMH
jgi:3-oxoacyl-[acyl-carrier protein] reductase